MALIGNLRGPAGVSSFAAVGPGGAAALAPSGTQTVAMDSSVKTVTPTGACTFNASGFPVGQQVTFVVTTAGATSFVLTWGAGFKAAGTLATGASAGKTFAVSFVCASGALWVETGRTGAM